MVDRYAANLKKMDFVWLEAGRDDEHGLHLAHRQVAKRLKQHNVPFELIEYPGKHGGHHWRFEDRMVRVLNRIG